MLGHKVVQKYLFGVDGHDRITCYLSFESGLVHRDCLFKLIIFYGHHLSQSCQIWRYHNIFEDFELVMIFLRSGQTRVDQSLCKVYETFWFGQLVFCGPNVM